MEKFRTFLKKSILILVIVSIVFLPFYLTYKNDEKNFRKFRETGDPYYVSEEFARGYNYGRSDFEDIALDRICNDLSDSHSENSILENLYTLELYFDDPSSVTFSDAKESLDSIVSYIHSVEDLNHDLSDGSFEFD